VRILHHELVARIDGCSLLVSDHDANAGTRKPEKKEKAGPQEKKKVVSINVRSHKHK